MIPNRPYSYLEEDEIKDEYHFHVVIRLVGHKFKGEEVIANTSLDCGDENHKRCKVGHAYHRRNMRRSLIAIQLVHVSGHEQLWSKRYTLTAAEIRKYQADKANFVQVLLKDEEQTHSGTSSGHYGEAD